MNDSNSLDYYKIVGVSNQADSNEIRTAYRKASLKVHPDRNPDDPLAAEKFLKLKIALEILLDPIKRSELDLKLSIQSSKAKRDEKLNSKRKTMLKDLEERERSFQKDESEMRNKKMKLDELKLAGARLRKEKEEQLRRSEVSDSKSNQPEFNASTSTAKPTTSTSNPTSQPTTTATIPSDLDPLNYTLKLKWNTKHLPKINTTETLQSFILSTTTLSSNEIESILMKPIDPSRPENLNKDIKLTALVSFKNLESFETFSEVGSKDDRWKKFKMTKISDLIDKGS
ncbi:uncharacterized protein MELLADRAFT_93106 [Melampsora larici-populina 98AG31]|uniref:J domain-containing protein n=1 Tax=Melampsora larici-populina (strain 98AG31 / pathotype 3-4-7) TaxID=747676 RepID=F4S3Y9_MELLP|nr:uncharacterized protein MELLADRAFT_93106 [Melampsora larici-populina 98AG31]EGG00656.1 hypothetical protein MELLADRAFT_93106 [Melampsora larici-populina 98AG31]